MTPGWVRRGRGGWLNDAPIDDSSPVPPPAIPAAAPRQHIEGDYVVFAVMHCPVCGESSAESGRGRGIRTTKTRRPERYHECQRCGARFKSMEE